MSPLTFDTRWFWHPDWTEEPSSSSAGGFVDFRKSFYLDRIPQEPLKIRISADTRFKLYLNSRFVHAGPVKGDVQMWFYDEIDVQPFLQLGKNVISVRVLRFYYATRFATSFPRTHAAGLFVEHIVTEGSDVQSLAMNTDGTWETSIDNSVRLPNDSKHDDFLHIYEQVDTTKLSHRVWKPAVAYKHLTSFGLATPWKLSPRMIPYPKLERTHFKALYNITSSVSRKLWEKTLLQEASATPQEAIILPAGSTHHIELEADYTTGYLDFIFVRPESPGSTLQVTYSECYEDTPTNLPYLRSKGNRLDTTKQLIGPSDTYTFSGPLHPSSTVHYSSHESIKEPYTPFHFRTFRLLALDITVSAYSSLSLHGIQITNTHYPLSPLASITPPPTHAWLADLWTTSLRTLQACMHDTYTDCPFYEQLQYAMDTRSSALFTYAISDDDKIARQAILQLCNSFEPRVGMTGSRAPSQQGQIIPNFSLFWVCMVADYYLYFGDKEFVWGLLGVVGAVMETFLRRVDGEVGLVRVVEGDGGWEFVDWTAEWKPFGIPGAGQRTGFLTMTSCLLVYTLRSVQGLYRAVGREAVAGEYGARADGIVRAIKDCCFDGEYFTDGLAKQATSEDYSQHSQVWAILCGAADEELGTKILEDSLRHPDRQAGRTFTKTSTAMSFYTLRALAAVGSDTYDSHFVSFWDPWRAQLAQNLSTWVEDNVSQRSDCHAWGSSPLFEFTTEVAGVQPGAPKWETIAFKPRVRLFPEFEARVPLGGRLGGAVAKVSWKTKGEGTIEVSMKVEDDGLESVDRVTVQVVLPGGRVETGHVPGNLTYTVP